MSRSQASASMTSRGRFLEVMRFGHPDRVPYFEEGIRDEVVHVWQAQGLSGRRELESAFPSDERERIELDLDPRPELKKWPTTERHLDLFRRHLNPDDPERFSEQWDKRVRKWRHRGHVLMLYVHEGFFLSMGVGSWQRFYDVMTQVVDNPGLVRKMMLAKGRFAAALTEKVLKEVNVDAVIFSEPIGGNEGPLISPEMYENIVLRSYEPVLDVLRKYSVETILFQTFANARILIPSILKWGFNGLWACEVNIEAMDYRGIRKEFGRDLRLIGGIDLDALRGTRDDIKKELQTKVPPLIDQGGYIPLADGRVREDVSFENYCYYRQLLRRIIEKA
mgnify:FL=1